MSSVLLGHVNLHSNDCASSSINIYLILNFILIYKCMYVIGKYKYISCDIIFKNLGRVYKEEVGGRFLKL